LVQPEDDVPYTLPTIPHPKVVLQDPEIDQSLDIRVDHDPIELKMMEVFQQVDAKSFGSHAFMLVTVETPCYSFLKHIVFHNCYSWDKICMSNTSHVEPLCL
jgi:hypothetical protein